MRIALYLVGLSIFRIAAVCQDAPTDLSLKSASIHLAELPKPGEPLSVVETFADRKLTLRYAQIVDLLCAAYGFEYDQIQGPEDLYGQRYDVVAEVPAGVTKVQAEPMLQSYVADWFNLTFHHLTKDLPHYQLRIAAGGQKMVQNTEPDAKVRQIDRGSFQAVPFPTLLRMLRMTLATPIGPQGGDSSRMAFGRVEDLTGLTGKYNFTLEFDHDFGVPESATLRRDGRPDIFQALEEQMGLELTKQTITVDTIVIDHVEKITGRN